MRGARYTPVRRACQAAVALLFVAIPFANARGWVFLSGTAIAPKVGALDFLEPASALGAALAAGQAGRWLLWALPSALLAVALGPALCAWACPWGLVSEGLDALRQRARPRPWTSADAPRVRLFRAAALVGLLALGALLGMPLAAVVAGPRIATAPFAELARLGALPPLSALLLGLLLALELLGPRRLLCRTLCPSGALATLVRSRRGLRVVVDPARCACPPAAACLGRCAWGIDPRVASSRDGCTACGACVDVCPRAALSWTAGAPTPPRAGAASERRA